jgi:hypothetical protein
MVNIVIIDRILNLLILFKLRRLESWEARRPGSYEAGKFAGV